MTAQTQRIRLKGVTLADPVGTPFQLYKDAIAALSGLVGWWDLLDTTGLITQVSGAISSAAALAGAGSLVQATGGERPTYDSALGALFSGGQVLDLSGASFPTASHTIAAIVNLASVGTVNMLGSFSGGGVAHRLFTQANGTVRYACGTAYSDVPMVTGLALVMADFVQSTGVVRTRVNGASPTANAATPGQSALVTDFYLGAVSASPTSPLSGHVLDVGIFTGALIGTATEQTIKDYFTEVRGGVTD
jgi:hypothetical protein